MLNRFGTFGAIAVIFLGIVGAVNAMLSNQYAGAGVCLLAVVLGSAAALYFGSARR